MCALIVVRVAAAGSERSRSGDLVLRMRGSSGSDTPIRTRFHRDVVIVGIICYPCHHSPWLQLKTPRVCAGSARFLLHIALRTASVAVWVLSVFPTTPLPDTTAYHTRICRDMQQLARHAALPVSTTEEERKPKFVNKPQSALLLLERPPSRTRSKNSNKGKIMNHIKQSTDTISPSPAPPLATYYLSQHSSGLSFSLGAKAVTGSHFRPTLGLQTETVHTSDRPWSFGAEIFLICLAHVAG